MKDRKNPRYTAVNIVGIPRVLYQQFKALCYKQGSNVKGEFIEWMRNRVNDYRKKAKEIDEIADAYREEYYAKEDEEGVATQEDEL